MRASKRSLVLGLCLFLRAGAWTGAHNEASRMAAILAADPFRSHPEWCAFAVYPDQMNDWGIAQGPHSRWAVWLLVREAVAALRAGDSARACVLASIAAHFPQDAAVMSHSVFLKMEEGPDDPTLLPSPLRAWIERLPVESATHSIRRYGGSQPEQLVSDKGFFKAALPPPELLRPMYLATHYFSHDWLEGAAAALAMPPERRGNLSGVETLAGHPGWGLQDIFPEREGKPAAPPVANWYRRAAGGNWSFYHRWLLAHYQGQYLLPFALFTGSSLSSGEPHFRDTRELKAIFAEEYRNAVEATVALYKYVSTAAQTSLQGDWQELPFEDLAANASAIVLETDREDWRRAASFLSEQLALARAGSGRIAAAPIITSRPPRRGHLIHFENSRVAGSRLSLRRRSGTARYFEITLETSDPAAMSALVDLLLDQLQAPLWGPQPPRDAVDALEKVWAGMALARNLRVTSRTPGELLSFILPRRGPVPFRNTEDDQRRFAKLTEATHPGAMEAWLRWLAGE